MLKRPSPPRPVYSVGASTAPPLSQRLPEPPADLADIYLLTVLGAGAGADARGPVLSIRSLSDRSVTCRFPLACADDGNGDEAAGLAATNRGVLKVYAAPGYGGGVFAVAAEAERGECARVRRGTFDEGDWSGLSRVVFVSGRDLAARVRPACVSVRGVTVLGPASAAPTHPPTHTHGRTILTSRRR